MIGAVDVGGTKIAVGLVTLTGELVDSVSIPTQPSQPYDVALGSVISALETLATSHHAPLLGIGVGMTGRIHPGGVLHENAFLPTWGGQCPSRDLSARFGVECAIENDADAAALAEHSWGVSARSPRLIYVTVSTGIGGGVVLDGKLYRGVGGCHPELGHHVIDPAGPACFCGAPGCWESLSSGTAMAAWARQQQGGDPGWDARVICDLAEQGHVAARQAVDRTARYLGVGLTNLITLFAPDSIVLGGGLMQRWGLFQEGVAATVRQHCGLVPWDKVTLTVSNLQHPGLQGAAATWLHHHGKEGYPSRLGK
eukprot:jgi/Mesvir1/6906/Mv09063-RA.1